MSADRKPVLFLLVPVLDEAPNLERLFADVDALGREFERRFALRFILVDDGSRDGTAGLADDLGRRLGIDLAVLRHDLNRGPGRAFATGFAHLAADLADDDWVLTLEGDNTSRLELLGQMFTRMQEGYDVVLASPYMYGGGITNTETLRVFLSFMANLFVKEALGISGIMTASSFFRLRRGAVVRRLQARYGPGVLERAGFESMLEELMKMIALKTAISEVPMVLDTSRRQGKSKMKLLRTIGGYLALYGAKGRWR